jgi:hypothetical protein
MSGRPHIFSEKFGFDKPLIAQDRLWVRFMAQIYNERSDYERLATAVLSLKNG